MDELQGVYKGEFTIDERKTMTAHALRELRKGKKLSQKEVAAYLNIPATTYNTYESGRSEPPIEILVRLSHLYNTSIDVIVMRDRLYRTADDMHRQALECQKQVDELSKVLDESGAEGEAFYQFRDMMKRFTDAMVHLSQTPGVQKAFDDSLKD